LLLLMHADQKRGPRPNNLQITDFGPSSRMLRSTFFGHHGKLRKFL